MLAERDEMEPHQTAVGTFGGDAAETPQEALDPGHRVAVNSSMFENQSRNHARPIRPSPMFNANRKPVHQHARELQIEPFQNGGPNDLTYILTHGCSKSTKVLSDKQGLRSMIPAHCSLWGRRLLPHQRNVMS